MGAWRQHPHLLPTSHPIPSHPTPPIPSHPNPTISQPPSEMSHSTNGFYINNTNQKNEMFVYSLWNDEVITPVAYVSLCPKQDFSYRRGYPNPLDPPPPLRTLIVSHTPPDLATGLPRTAPPSPPPNLMTSYPTLDPSPRRTSIVSHTPSFRSAYGSTPDSPPLLLRTSRLHIVLFCTFRIMKLQEA